MPLIRKLEAGLWEVRSRLPERIARVIFTVEGDAMVLLHGFIKQSQKTPRRTCNLPGSACDPWERNEESKMNEKHLGSSLDDFLEEEGRLAEAEAVAAKRVLAFQIAQLMAEQQLSKSEMARRMNTSRAAVDRLLDSDTESATLATLEKAAAALGRRLHVALV